MKKIWIIAALLCTGVYFCGHSSVNDGKELQGTLERVDDLNAAIYCVGVPLGGAIMKVGEERFSDARVCYFNNPVVGYEDVLQRKVDGFLYSRHILDYVDVKHPDLVILPGEVGRADVAVAFSPKQGDLRYEVNKYISRYKEDGTYQSMYERWFKSGRPQVIPQIDGPPNPGRTIRVGICSRSAPMCFRTGQEDELSGFEIELLRRMAGNMNVCMELQELERYELFTALAEGRVDMVLAGLVMDEKRPDEVIYSKSYIDSGIVAIVRAESVKSPEK